MSRKLKLEKHTGCFNLYTNTSICFFLFDFESQKCGIVEILNFQKGAILAQKFKYLTTAIFFDYFGAKIQIFDN